jgi:prevent-host-death family protein
MEGSEDVVGVRELRQNLSVYLRRVRAGETLRVTERGQPVALLTPLPARSSVVDRLVAAGRARRATGDLLDLPPPLHVPTSMSSQDALDLERAERLP